MPSNVQVDAARRAVVATVTGTIGPQEVAAIVARVRQQAAAQDYGIVYDVIDAESPEISRSDLFWFTRTLPELRDAAAKRVRVAIVHRPNQVELASFWETTARNAGFQARAFTEREPALAWAGDAPHEAG